MFHYNSLYCCVRILDVCSAHFLQELDLINFRHDKFRAIIMTITAVKLELSVLGSGVVCSVNHVSDTVSFRTISLPVFTALRHIKVRFCVHSESC